MEMIGTSSLEKAEMERREERGFMLVGLIVAIFFVLLALSVAAPKMAQALRREREVEAVHRGNQYVRAIRLYYRRFGHYPGSMDQLEKTNNIRFLRQQYVDPFTGKPDWRLIKVGEAKTTVKGFFGQPLAGLAPGLGSAAGNASTGPAGAGAAGSSGYGGSSPSAFGGSSPSAFGSSSPGGGLGSSSPGGGGLGSSSGLGGSSALPTLGGGSSTTGGATSGAAGNGPPTLGGSSSGSGPGSGTTGSGPGTSSLGSLSGNASDGGATSGGTPFVGVGVPKEGDSIRVLNEQTTYNTWEFLYDPRIEQLYAKGALFGGGASGLGSAGGNNSGFGNTPGSGFGNTPGSGFGNSPGSGFGNTPGSGYGNTPGLGSSPGSSSPTAPSAPPQQPQ